MSLSFIGGKAGGQPDELLVAATVLLQPTGTDTADARSCSDAALLREARERLFLPVNNVC